MLMNEAILALERLAACNEVECLWLIPVVSLVIARYEEGMLTIATRGMV